MKTRSSLLAESADLLLGLSLLHHLPAHFDPRGEDGAAEVGHADALQVTHLLGR